jgi:hypothetical protein
MAFHPHFRLTTTCTVFREENILCFCEGSIPINRDEVPTGKSELENYLYTKLLCTIWSALSVP